MQTISQQMTEAIRGTYQVPLAKIEIYNQDGSLAATITDVVKCEVNVAGSRKVLRTFTAELDDSEGILVPDPDQFDRNILWYNKTAKIFYGLKTGAGDQYLPEGVFTIDSIKPDVRPEGVTLEISGQDLISKMLEDKFDDVYTVEDAAATESVNYALASSGSTASSTSSVSAGDEVQSQGRIHYADCYATINGIPKKVINENTGVSSKPSRILDGDPSLSGWRFDFVPDAGETVTQIEAEVFVDLQSAEAMQQIQLIFESGTVLTDFVYTSPDNAAWTSYTTTTINPVGLVRYIKFRARKQTASADASWTLAIFEVKVLTSATFAPGSSIDGDVYDSHWRPRIPVLDPDPKITIAFGSSRTINVIYLYWGNEGFDFWNRVNYYLEYSTNGSSWTRIPDLNGLDETRSLFGDVEHVISPVSCTHIRISIKGRDGVSKLRHIKAVNVSSGITTVDNVIYDVVSTIFPDTQIQIPFTRRWIKSKQAEIGDDKEGFCRTAAAAIGWVDPYFDENGIYKTGPRNIDPVRPAWDFSEGIDNIFSFSPLFSNDISNVILVIYKSSGAKAIVGRAEDSDPLSPTFTGTLGRRVFTYDGDSYDTQDKCDQIARQKLFQRTRFKHQTSLPITGHPALQVDDVVTVTVYGANVIDYHYLVTGFVTTFEADTAKFDTRINISQI